MGVGVFYHQIGGNIMGNTAIKRVFQIGIAVPDALAAAKNFCQLFEIDEEKMRIIDTRTTDNRPMRYMGREIVACNLIAMVQAANVEFEFIQHVEGDANFHKDFLEQHGAGINHICIDVANYQEMVDQMEKMEGSVLNDGGEGLWGYKYMDMRESMGMIFELYNDGLRDSNMK